jgi:hypothetical protein
MVSNSGDGSNRSKHSKTGLIALAFVLALILGALFINSGLSRDAVYQGQANTNTREYAAYTDQQIRQSCIRLIGDEKTNCIAKYQHERRNNERNEQDLVAQRQSANWAYITGAAAVIGMVLSVIGVVLVWTTFDETRKANKITKAQQRARVEASFKLTEGNRFTYPRIALTGKNIGQTSAFNAIMYSNFSPTLPVNPHSTTEAGNAHSISASGSANFAIAEPDPPNATHYYIYGRIEYDCIFGEQHISYFCVNIQPAIADPSIPNRGPLVAVPCRPANWPADT